MGNIPEIDFTKIDSIPVLGEITPEEEVDNFLQGSPIPKLEVDSISLAYRNLPNSKQNL